MKRAFTLSTLFALFALAIGCMKLDRKKLETSIRDGLEKKGITLESLECPDGRQAKKGDTFDCKATTEGGEDITISVEQTDSVGTISWKLDGLILNLEKIGDSIEESVGKSADVKCPKKSQIVKVGKSFTCDVDIEGKKHQVVLKVADKAGNVSWKLKD